MARKRAVILLSGGLDSATALAVAKDQQLECYALSFDYGQRHACELRAAQNVAQRAEVAEHKIMRIDLSQIGGSALTDQNIAVPKQHTEGIPVTYVPARNTIFLSLALAWAEVLQAGRIFIGVNAVDYSGYPDCRPEYIAAYQHLANLATKAGVENHALSVETPLISLTKAQIIQLGVTLGVDYAITVSCYDPNEEGEACGHCDSCRLRIQGFHQANITDPTRYQ